MSEVVLKLFMFYHPIQPLCCGTKSLPVIRINLPGAASPRDEPFHMLDELLSCLVWQQLPYLSNTPTNLCMALLNFSFFCFVLYCYAFVQYCNVKTIQYNAMHKFVGVLDNPRNSRWTALVKLQANNKIYAFPSFFVLSLYPIGPAKSRPTTSKGVDPSVLSVGKFPTGGFEKAVTWNFLHL